MKNNTRLKVPVTWLRCLYILCLLSAKRSSSWNDKKHFSTIYFKIIHCRNLISCYVRPLLENISILVYNLKTVLAALKQSRTFFLVPLFKKNLVFLSVRKRAELNISFSYLFIYNVKVNIKKLQCNYFCR